MWITYKGPTEYTPKYEYEPHNFKSQRGIPWLVCKSCGLISLRNEFTKWCVSKGCLNEYHSQYKQAMKSLSGAR